MFRQRFTLLCLLCLTAMFSLPTQAQSAASAQQKLSGYQQQLQQLRASQQQVEAELNRSKAALTPLKSQSGPEKVQLDKALKDLQAAKDTYAANPTEENQARLKNEEFQHALAERKYKKANAELYELQEKVDELTQELEQTNGKIQQLDKAVADQAEVVKAAQAREATARQAQAAEEQRLKAEAAQAEIERLKAELAEQKRMEEARMAAEKAAEAEAAAKATAATSTTKSPASATTPSAAGQAQAGKPQSAPAAAKKTVADSEARQDKSSGAIRLSSATEVQTELKRMNALLATPDKGKRQYNKILHVKAVAANGETGPAASHSLNTLGHNQYKGNAEIPAGETMLIIGFNRWRETVSATAGNEFVVIFDGSDPKNPRLVYYPKALDQ